LTAYLVKIVLYAVSSPYAAEALETVRRLDHELVACVRNLPVLAVPAEVERLVELSDAGAEVKAAPFIVPLTTPRHRRDATADALSRGFTSEATLIDPTAVVARTASLGPGAYINAGAILAAGVRAGKSLSVNRRATLGHHNTIGDFVSVGPGVATGGECIIEDGVLLGVGAVLAPQVTVGAGTVVGAGAVVVEDVPAGAVVVGNPARQLEVSAATAVQGR
jgi:sugar O-acyltransferase (sialic acid O-acetyltransferase NeuD family)